MESLQLAGQGVRGRNGQRENVQPLGQAAPARTCPQALPGCPSQCLSPPGSPLPVPGPRLCSEAGRAFSSGSISRSQEQLCLSSASLPAAFPANQRTCWSNSAQGPSSLVSRRQQQMLQREKQEVPWGSCEARPSLVKPSDVSLACRLPRPASAVLSCGREFHRAGLATASLVRHCQTLTLEGRALLPHLVLSSAPPASRAWESPFPWQLLPSADVTGGQPGADPAPLSQPPP